MAKTLRIDAINGKLQERGWTQAELAELVLRQQPERYGLAKGRDFPRPKALLKLAVTLGLAIEKLVDPGATEPQIAYRKKAGAKTTDQHISKARGHRRSVEALGRDAA